MYISVVFLFSVLATDYVFTLLFEYLSCFILSLLATHVIDAILLFFYCGRCLSNALDNLFPKWP